MTATVVDPSAYMLLPHITQALRWLRQNVPRGFEPFWIVTEHTDILERARQTNLFPSAERVSVLNDAHADSLVRGIRGGSPHLACTISNMDDPEHRKYRTLLPQIRSLALADTSPGRGPSSSALQTLPIRFKAAQQGGLTRKDRKID